MMEDSQITETSEPRSSQVLTPPDGKSMVSTQQVDPGGSVANANVSVVPPSVPAKNTFLQNCKRSFLVGLRKLWILLWKNLLIRLRAYVLLVFEILFTIGFVAQTLGEGSLVKEGPGGVIKKPETPAKTFMQIDMIDSFKSSFEGKEMLFVPVKGDPTTNAKDILDGINGLMSATQKITWTPHSTEAEVETEFNKMYAKKRSDFEGAIIFKKLDSVKKHVEYKIRMTKDEGVRPPPSPNNLFGRVYVHSRTDILFRSTNPPGPNEAHQQAYFQAGLLGLQLLIDDNAVKVLGGPPTGFDQEVTLKSFPYPKYKEIDERTGTSTHFISFSLGLIFIFIFSNAFLVRSVGSEKETGVKELLKLCGYPGWMQWLTWHMIPLMIQLIPFAIFVLGLKFYPIKDEQGNVQRYLENSDISLWFVVLILVEISNNAFVFFLASLIKSTSVATGIVVMWTFFGTLAVAIVLSIVKKQTFSLYMGFLFLPNGCMLIAFKFLIYFEQLENGGTWLVLGRPLPNIPGMNLGYVILMFLVNIVAYQSLAVYLEAILPSNYGVRKPVYFPIQAIATFIMNLVKRKKRRGTDPTTTPSHIEAISQSKATGFEPYQGPSTTIGVDVQNLVKKFDRNKVAVNGVSVKMYDGQIFALLGHNGAGKTTLISMLTGMFAPTSGTARVGGHDIRTDMDLVRQSLGLCPQHDMLFNNLTVMEHLQIFGAMKGQSCGKVKKEANQLLLTMRMVDKANVLSKKLSGGQKRKLCLGMALIGEAKVVILDEPTSGMDPEARRAIWDILLSIRGQRTILLTTHHMEEADVLGDRIGIMAEGKLQCCGSPAYLKSFYGMGYTLKVALFPGADKHAILSLVQKHISDASPKPIIMPNELFIALPTETAIPSALASLFSELTAKKDDMHIESLGLSVASMDEIFVKVGELSERAAVEDHTTDLLKSKSSAHTTHHHDDDHQKKKHKNHDQAPESKAVHEAPSASTGGPVEGSVRPLVVDHGTKSGTPPTPKPTTRTLVRSRGRAVILLRLIVMQALAILIKRFIITRRKIGFLIFQLVFPTLCMLGIMLGSNAIYKPDPLPPALEFTLNAYKDPVTLYSADQSLKDKAGKQIHPVSKFTGNVENDLKKIGESDPNFFRDNYIVAGEITSDKCIAWFNTIPLHAAPLAINLASNLRGSALNPPFTFQVTNHPLQTKDALLIKAALEMKLWGFFLALLLGFLMMFPLSAIAVCFIHLPVEERLNKSRQLQLMTGMHPLNYWMITFFWDFVIILMVAILMITIAAICETFHVFSSYHTLGIIFLLILSFGYVMIPLAYMLSNLPRTVAGGVIMLLVLLLSPVLPSVILLFKAPVGFAWMARLFPIIGMSLSFVFVGLALGNNGKCGFVRELGDDGKKTVCELPTTTTTTTTTTRGLLGQNVDELRACCEKCGQGILSGVSCYKPEEFFTWTRPGLSKDSLPGPGQILFCFFVISVLCQAIHLIIQLGGWSLLRSIMIRASLSDFVDNVHDEDVQLEKQRVAQLIMTKQTGSDAFVVADICKNYCSLAAVSKLTFGVHHGECFGLLGTNGAGKTTTFRIITGDEVQSLGDAYEGPFSLSKSRRKLISNIGYCPQFDAFIPYLTGKENVQMFARLRGVPWKQVNALVDQLLERVGLTASKNILCRKYSGGMKRRLSAAIAFIGDPAVLLLDEPTSGVDPVSRRQFWKIIESVKASGKSIILTSHSMDECEALCSRLGIMVNGELQCIGGVQHLKHKFAQGYNLTLRLKPMPMADIQSSQQQPQLFLQQPQFQQPQSPFLQQQQFQQPQSPFLQQQQFQQPSQFQQPLQFQQQQQFQQPLQFQQFQRQNALGGMLEGLNKEICEKFHPCTLKDQHETLLQYQIGNTAIGWDLIYKTLEDLKKSYEDIVEDYSVSETSLEEVFLAFSRAQYAPRTARVPTWKRVLTCQC